MCGIIRSYLVGTRLTGYVRQIVVWALVADVGQCQAGSLGNWGTQTLTVS